MADDVTLPGTGSVVATDEVNMGDGLAHVQFMKLADGTEGGTEGVPATAARGLSVDPRLKVVRLQVTPTISTTAYAAKDNVGGLMTFSNAVRASGGSARLEAVQVVDKDQERTSMDLVLFDRTITAPTDNAAFDPSDTELGYCVGVVPIYGGDYHDFNDNAVANKMVGLEFLLNGTDLFGVLVARATPTFTATSDLVVTLTIAQE